MMMVYYTDPGTRVSLLLIDEARHQSKHDRMFVILFDSQAVL